MTYIPEQDFNVNVSKGDVPGHSYVHKFGRNDAVASGAWEGVNLLSGAFNFLTAASTVRVKAGGDGNDTAAGTGARSVTVEGLDSSLDEASEAVATAGASASSATSTSFWRVFRAYVTPASAGAYGGNNVGQVVIENSGGGTDLISIGAGEGQSQYGAYAIPSGKTGYLMSAHVTVDATKAADIRIFTRAGLNDFSTPFEPARLKLYWDGILGKFAYLPKAPELSIAAGSDIWVEARGSGGVTEVSANFEILLVDN
jgi:hypothetical protein